MTAPQLFTFESNQIRTQADEHGVVWFVANDVATALGYADPNRAILQHVNEDGVAQRPLIDKLGRNQVATFIDESGIYDLVLASKLPSARAFRLWVTRDVLPAIRRDGGYIAPTATPEQLATLEQKVSDQQREIRRLESNLNDQRRLSDNLRAQVDRVDKALAFMPDAAQLQRKETIEDYIANILIVVNKPPLTKYIRDLQTDVAMYRESSRSAITRVRELQKYEDTHWQLLQVVDTLAETLTVAERGRYKVDATQLQRKAHGLDIERRN